MDFAQGPVLFHRELRDGNSGYDLRLCEGWEVYLTLRGKGSVENAAKPLASLDELDRTFADSPPVACAIDLSSAENAPLRVQLMLGQWLLKKRHRIHKMAVFGGPPLPMKIARAVCTIARMEQVAFLDSRGEALGFLARAT